jgi:hypothetical protein
MVLARTAAIPVSAVRSRAEVPADRRQALAGAHACWCPSPRPITRLAGCTGMLPGAGRDYIQLVLSDRSGTTAGRDFGVVSPKTWASGRSWRHALLCEGIGCGHAAADGGERSGRGHARAPRHARPSGRRLPLHLRSGGAIPRRGRQRAGCWISSWRSARRKEACNTPEA